MFSGYSASTGFDRGGSGIGVQDRSSLIEGQPGALQVSLAPLDDEREPAYRLELVAGPHRAVQLIDPPPQ